MPKKPTKADAEEALKPVSEETQPDPPAPPETTCRQVPVRALTTFVDPAGPLRKPGETFDYPVHLAQRDEGRLTAALAKGGEETRDVE